MGKTVSAKPSAGKSTRRISRRSLFLINFVLFMIPATYFGYPYVLRWSASLIMTNEELERSDAILVLAGGEPGRAWEAADLFNANLAQYVIVTKDQTSLDELELRRRGIELVDGHGNYVRVLRGMGVPEERIVTVTNPVVDTFNELQQARDLCAKRNWNSIIIVTSNYHTRRARLTARYVFGKGFHVSVAAAKHGGLNPNGWWKNNGDVRTFLIEFDKLVAYILYIGPRTLWTSLSERAKITWHFAEVGQTPRAPVFEIRGQTQQPDRTRV